MCGMLQKTQGMSATVKHVHLVLVHVYNGKTEQLTGIKKEKASEWPL